MSEKVAIIGLGYVGIPLAHAMAEVGIEVLGFDVDTDRVAQLKRGESPLRHIDAEKIAAMVESGFDATSDYSRSAECDYLIICVPTPLNKSREPDLSFVEATMQSLQPHLRAGQMLALESTTWPGTTEEVLRPYVEARGLEVGQDFYLVYSPEREDPGNPDFTTKSIPKIVGGSTPACLERGCSLYNRFIDTVVPVSSTQAAELVKLLENIHRAINIGLVNELKVVADGMGLDIFEIVDAAKTKPFGFTAYYPGPGIGGHCIPIDPFYLTWKAKEFGVHTRFIELAGEVNEAMPDYVARKVMLALNERGKAVKGARILALGIAYKPDVDDMRESPSVHVMEILRDWGAAIEYSDEYVPVFPKMREHNFDLTSVDLTPEVIGSYDAVVVLTNHSTVDYDAIRQHSSLIIDSRGVYRDPAPHIFRA